MFEDQVIVIVGATGSGKTGVAIEVAKEIYTRFGFEAEIISADSRTVYCGLDVGTAKPTLEERSGIRHYGFDLVDLGERFTVVDWQKYAKHIIEEIENEKKMPIVVGGTGFYVDALIFDYKFRIEGKGYGRGRGAYKKDEQEYLARNPDRQKSCSKYKIFGIEWKSSVLKDRLLLRANKMFDQKLYDETENLVRILGEDEMKKIGNVYRFAWDFLNGKITREEAVRLNALYDYHLAKRQSTWFKRNKNITWLPLEKIKPAVIKCIQDGKRK